MNGAALAIGVFLAWVYGNLARAQDERDYWKVEYFLSKGKDEAAEVCTEAELDAHRKYARVIEPKRHSLERRLTG